MDVVPTFDELTTPRLIEPGRYALEIPDGWQQGRGAFGGLVLASAVRAIDAHAATPDRTLRSLTGQLSAPLLPGAAEIVVEPLRIGNGVSTLTARIRQGSETCAYAVAVLGRQRATDADMTGVARPPMPPWRELAPTLSFAEPPPFVAHFEQRDVGPPPFSHGEPRTAGWVRPLRPGARHDAAFLVGCADAWWPAIFVELDGLRPMATISFTADIVGTTDGLDPEAPLFHDARVLATRDGYSTELRTLWGEDGRLLALNHQTLAIIR